MEEITEQLKEEIREAYDYFKGPEHFDEVFDQAGWNEDNMRILDCGYVKGLQYAISKIQEKYKKDEQKEKIK